MGPNDCFYTSTLVLPHVPVFDGDLACIDLRAQCTTHPRTSGRQSPHTMGRALILHARPQLHVRTTPRMSALPTCMSPHTPPCIHEPACANLKPRHVMTESLSGHWHTVSI
jgi:hypothetical protein